MSSLKQRTVGCGGDSFTGRQRVCGERWRGEGEGGGGERKRERRAKGAGTLPRPLCTGLEPQEASPGPSQEPRSGTWGPGYASPGTGPTGGITRRHRW